MIIQDGKVAIRRVPAIPKFVQVGQSQYVFSVRHNISLAWVDEADVQKILDYKYDCNCGSTPKPVHYLCDEVHLNRWLVGGR